MIRDVLVASSASVAKVFLISGVGYLAALRPRSSPILPSPSVNMLSRFAMNLLFLPLIYVSLGQHLTADVLTSLWFVVVAGLAVIPLSYLTATALGKIWGFRPENDTDFDALRIAASFPNVVAVPLLMFPSLCEYEVVYEGVTTDGGGGAAADGEVENSGGGSGGGGAEADKVEECTSASNAMVFAYFLAWTFMFFAWGLGSLVDAAERHRDAEAERRGGMESSVDLGDEEEEGPFRPEGPASRSRASVVRGNGVGGGRAKKLALKVFLAAKKAITSPGFIAMVLGVVTALIPPLQAAMFEAGGALRFLGGAIESLGMAAPALMTMFAAASLVEPSKGEEEDDADRSGNNNAVEDSVDRAQQRRTLAQQLDVEEDDDEEDSCGRIQEDGAGTRAMRVISDVGPDGVLAERSVDAVADTDTDTDTSESHAYRPDTDRRSSFQSFKRASARFGTELRRTSALIAPAMRTPTFRMHAWFCLSRLVVAPALTCAILIGLDCGTSAFEYVPHYAKMVVLLNASLPGAVTVVVVLKSQGLDESAGVLTKVYFPSYLLSILTIAGWSSVGLLISLPGEDGTRFCHA